MPEIWSISCVLKALKQTYNHIARAKHFATQYMVFSSHLIANSQFQKPVRCSHLKLADPSLALSQKQLAAVCKPAPFLWTITQVTTYLKGLLRAISLFVLFSQMSLIHWPIFECSYVCCPRVSSTHSLRMVLIWSLSKAVSSLKSIFLHALGYCIENFQTPPAST